MGPLEIIQSKRIRVYIDDEGVTLIGAGVTPELSEWAKNNVDQLKLKLIPKNTLKDKVEEWKVQWMKTTGLNFLQRNWIRDIATSDFEVALSKGLPEEELKPLFDRMAAQFKDSYLTRVDGRGAHVVVPQIALTSEGKERANILFN